MLQPVAHALLQAADDLSPALAALSADQLWQRPGKSASIGYHLAHVTGSLDRLFTYARGESLTSGQRAALVTERTVGESRPSLATLLASLATTIERALRQLRTTAPSSLLEVRLVGRARLPTSTLGILFHAAEHTTRHAGQILTLVRVVQ